MPRFLIAIHHPDDYDPATAEDEAMGRAIDELNDAMVAEGVRVFVGGLHPARDAVALTRTSEGTVQVHQGAYLPTTEHVGGFWVVDVADLEAALEWGRQAVVACRAPVEVRQFH